MTIYAFLNAKYDFLILITISIIGFVILVLASLIKHRKNKQLNHMFEIQSQQSGSIHSISSVVNYPALSLYFQNDLNDKI